MVASICVRPRSSKPQLPCHLESHRHLCPHNSLGPLQRERLSSVVAIHLRDPFYVRNRQPFEEGRTAGCRREDFGFYTQMVVRRECESLESALNAIGRASPQVITLCRNLLSLQIQVQVDVRWLRLQGLQSSVLLILGSRLLSANSDQGSDRHLDLTCRKSKRQHEDYRSWDLAWYDFVEYMQLLRLSIGNISWGRTEGPETVLQRGRLGYYKLRCLQGPRQSSCLSPSREALLSVRAWGGTKE